jgi:hypothetical protein
MKTIYFTQHAMALLHAYIDCSDGEVSGIGKVERLNSGDFLVTETRLLEQESTWTSTVLDEKALTRFLTELVAQGEDPSSYKLWWHSHGDFDVFFSTTDEATCRRFNNRWMISVVANKSQDYLGRIDVYEPIHLSAELPVRVYTHLEDEQLEAIKEEVKRKVHCKTWAFHEYGRRRWENEEEQTSRSHGEDVREEGP